VATVVKTRWWETGFQDDRTELAKFVSDLWSTLEEAFAHPSLLGSDDIAGSLQAVLRDLQPAVEVTQRALAEPAWISDTDLDRAGLLGTQLALKLDAYRTAEVEYIEARNVLISVDTQAAPEDKVSWLKKFKNLLRPGNIIVGTVAAFFPPAEGLKEGKELAELYVERAGADAEEAH
jgi:hypothetical protein